MAKEPINLSIFTSSEPAAVAWRRAQIVASNAIEGIESHADNIAWDERQTRAGFSVEDRLKMFIALMKEKAKRQTAA